MTHTTEQLEAMLAAATDQVFISRCQCGDKSCKTWVLSTQSSAVSMRQK